MKPEADPTLCEASDCTNEATTPTPAGPLCDEHAADYARSHLRGADR